MRKRTAATKRVREAVEWSQCSMQVHKANKQTSKEEEEEEEEEEEAMMALHFKPLHFNQPMKEQQRQGVLTVVAILVKLWLRVGVNVCVPSVNDGAVQDLVDVLQRHKSTSGHVHT